MRFGIAQSPSGIFRSPSASQAGTPPTPFCGKPGCRKRFNWLPLILLSTLVTPALAQDIRGLEVCTTEKDMTRRTSCLQSNVELLQQELTKQARRAQDDRTAATKEIAVLKADVATLKAALEKTQSDLTELKKPKPLEKK